MEQAAKDAGETVTVPVSPGRGDATQDTTDLVAQAFLQPTADGFRNYFNASTALRSPVWWTFVCSLKLRHCIMADFGISPG